jgi:hypothetical protein
MAAILESKMGFSEPIQGNNFIKQQYPQYINGFPPATGVFFIGLPPHQPCWLSNF